LPLIFPEHFNRFAPRRFLTIIDLPQIQDLPLHHTLPRDTTSLDNTSVAMRFAIFETGLGTEKHTKHFQEKLLPIKHQGRHYRRISADLLRPVYFISIA